MSMSFSASFNLLSLRIQSSLLTCHLYGMFCGRDVSIRPKSLILLMLTCPKCRGQIADPSLAKRLAEQGEAAVFIGYILLYYCVENIYIVV